jgi:hypothetical protein
VKCSLWVEIELISQFSEFPVGGAVGGPVEDFATYGPR